MLPKQYRLNEKADFKKVLKQGKMQHGRFLALSVLETETQEKKGGIIVSNKVSKNATERNRIRRVIREALKTKITEIPQGRLLVFLVKIQAAGQENPAILKEALWLLKKC